MSQSEISYKTRNKIYNFLLDEFLNADQKTLSAIIDHYYRQYGNGAGNYLRNTYYSWKMGSTGVSSQTFGRVVTFMPLYLTKEKRFYILKSEVERFVDELFITNPKDKKTTIIQLNNRFEEFQRQVLTFNADNLKWFIGKNIFTNDLVEKYLEMCKYVLNQNLIQLHKSIYDDLNILFPKISHFRNNIKSADYMVTSFNQEIDLLNANRQTFVLNKLETIKFEFNNSFDGFGQEYYLNELLKVSFNAKEKQSRSVVMEHDLNFSFTEFNKLKLNQTEISIKSTFEGSGGTLRLSIEHIPLNMLRAAVLKDSIKITVLLLIISALIIILFHYPAAAWIGLIVTLSLLSGISTLVRKVYSTIQQINRYGK
ncbi:hypothetical protein GCM10027037_21890 [Mucilaginibacter koreensis]